MKFSEEELSLGVDYLQRLKEKYEGIGQDFFDYLEGLVQSNGLTYWDYIHLNSLLGLQAPRTNHPDEMIFIVYHQITELYFKLIKHELKQLTSHKKKEYLHPKMWIRRTSRAVNYMRHLCDSLDIMHSGMDYDQFRQFRMALLPASGFQSVQYRHIEIMSTNLDQLLRPNFEPAPELPMREKYEQIYWKAGGIETKSGNKTLTLRQFEWRYDDELKKWIRKYEKKNLYYLYQHLPAELKEREEIVEALKTYDTFFNIHWRMAHLASASRYLPKDAEGTGGTNWREYLPPRFQKTIFFPDVWSGTEIDEWGKAGILRIFRKQVTESWMKADEGQ